MRRFRGLPRRQHEVFEQVAVNNDTGHHPATLAALERKGLIVSTERTLPGRFPVVIKDYAVPLPIHIEWCSWCD